MILKNKGDKDFSASDIIQDDIVESRNKYSLLFDSMLDAALIVDQAELKIVEANKTAAALYGYSFEEFKGMNALELSAEPEKTIRSIQDPYLYVPLRYHKKKDGTVFPVEITTGTLVLNGRPTVISMIRDISVRFEMEEALKKRETAYRTLAENIPAIVYRRYISKDNKMLVFNDMLKTMTGYDADELEEDFDRIIFKQDLENFKKTISTAVLMGKAFRAEYRITHKTGDIRYFAEHGRPVLNGEGGLEYIDGVIFDDTQRKRAEEKVRIVQKELLEKYSYRDIIGKSAAIRKIKDILPAISASDCNILIEGPSGTGKNLIAKAIHSLSLRRTGPFVTVNCGAIPETLLESELFGYAKGAFTDAKSDKPGKIAAADGGIIFLDEIGEMPLGLQVKILHFIEEKTYEPLGSNKPLKADVRIIASTNRDLLNLVRENNFRSDLYYRLKIVSLKVPPLCERFEDIELLIQHFIDIMNGKYSKSITALSNAAHAYLLSYEFPGNVRELQNIIEHAAIFCEGGVIEADHFPEEYKNKNTRYLKGNTNEKVCGDETNELKSVKIFSERVYLVGVLNKFDGSRKEASKFLNISRVELWRKMKKHKLI